MNVPHCENDSTEQCRDLRAGGGHGQAIQQKPETRPPINAPCMQAHGFDLRMIHQRGALNLAIRT